MTESQIRDQIVEYLEAKGCMVWKDKQVVTKPRKGTMHKSSGVPDICGILRDGTFLGIEVKTPKGKASDIQKEFISKANKRYAICFVARSVDDVIKYEKDNRMDFR